MNTNFGKTIGQIILTCFVLITLALPEQSQGQFTDNNQTNIISGVTIDWLGDYHVGSNYVFDALLILNGGVLSNAIGYIGYEAGADNNTAMVSDSGSIWNNTNLYVAYSGGSNSLVITNGGSVFDAYAAVGRDSNAINNTVLVTGSGSLWSNIFCHVGYFGASNGVVIRNGGVVSFGQGIVGVRSNAANNNVLVTGSGSLLTSLGNLFVGYEGSGNRLVISNQAGVVGGHGEVGHYGSNNSVLVTGTGAAWNNNNNLYLGVYGMGNTLLISNAGRVYNNHGLVGFYSNSINNSAIVSGLGTVWSNRFVLHVGESGASNTLVITDRGAVFDSEGIVGYSNGSSNNSVIVTRAAVWSNTNLFVGGYGAGNRLVITNQSRVLDDEGIMGYAIESDNNSVLVTGFNSSWSNRADLFIGRYGSGNTMIISNQAKVYDNFGVMGYYSDSSNNSAIVSGPGSVWSNAASMYCGLSGAGNTLIITNGGAIGMGDPGAGAYIGRNSSSSNNTVLVTGPGSVWTNPGGLHVGYDGSGNGLLISNQGKVFDNQGEMGRGSSNNFVIVTGLGSVWSNSLTMVFASGSGNSLLISNGGAVFSYDAAVGGPGNSALVTGPGSVWNNSFNLTIGDYGSGNRLVIRDQGKVFDFNGAVSGRDTSVLVTGAGSVWSNSYLRVGGDLVISNQGAVFSDYGDVGLGGSNVSVRVVDNGLWQNKSTLSVGVGSSGNDLTIAGGTVLASNAFISFVDDTHEGGTNNLIRVDGGNLVVTNRAGTGTLVVSSGEGSGSLIINGGSVTAERLVLTNGNNSIIVFNGGTLHNKGTTVTNNQSFVVGDGISSATFHLLGGLHSFNDGLILRSNSFLTGCGTINGNVVIDPGSAVRADCSTLLFTDSVTNNGTMVADGAVLESSGMLVNNGKIFLLHGGTTNFHGTFINNGVILNGDIHLAIERDGSGGYFLRYTAAPAVRYRLQRAASVTGPWSDLATNTAPASGLVEFHETSPPPGQAFYRTVQP